MANSSSEDVDLAIAAVVIDLLEEENEKKRKRRTRQWIKRRRSHGIFQNLVNELRMEDPASLRNWMRMDEGTFQELVTKLTPILKKQDTVFKESISVEERLAIALRYLATGCTFIELSYQFRIGERTASYVVMETCEALHVVLKDTFALPQTPEEWKRISKDFEDRWNFPHCLGTIDGKHIVIEKPVLAGSHYHNYKGSESIVLMAIVDANLQFRYIDVGTNGRVSDGGVWNKCRVSQLLESGSLNIPKEEKIENTTFTLPYVFLADDAFALKPYLLKPFPRNGNSKEERIFNYRLSRARRCVESAFGILANRFRIFLKPIKLKPSKVTILVLAACALHNYLRIKAQQIYSPSSLIDAEDVETGKIIPGSWRSDTCSSYLPIQPTSSRHPTTEAKLIRQRFSDYFVSPSGSVFWQWNFH